MAILATALPLSAQLGESRVSDHQECNQRAEPSVGNPPGRVNTTFGCYNQTTSQVSFANGSLVAIEPTTLRSSAAFTSPCDVPVRCPDWFVAFTASPQSIVDEPESGPDSDKPRDNSNASPVVLVRNPKPPGINQSAYYRNRLEFSMDGGWLPINIPFVFDVFLGDSYNMTSLRYTLVPVIASLRWQMSDVDGPWIFRGNWELEASGAFTFIPRGPETRYIAWIMGVRRNFVPRRGRIAPYFDGRLGLGGINAKEPAGVLYAQGQDFTFTVNMGSGVRYNFNSRYSISAGLNWMHISNLYLSEPKFSNYGINVYGPMFGIDVRLGKPHFHASQ